MCGDTARPSPVSRAEMATWLEVDSWRFWSLGLACRG